MDDIFEELAQEIIKARGDLSRLFHGEALGKEGLKTRVSEMSEQELLTFISTTAQTRLKAEGETMNAVKFFAAVARCSRRVRKEVS